jgi:hypothetical protein
LVCVAADFTKYDAHAVQQINRNIELIRYRLFGEELMLLKLVNAASGGKPGGTATSRTRRAETRKRLSAVTRPTPSGWSRLLIPSVSCWRPWTATSFLSGTACGIKNWGQPTARSPLSDPKGQCFVGEAVVALPMAGHPRFTQICRPSARIRSDVPAYVRVCRQPTGCPDR